MRRSRRVRTEQIERMASVHHAIPLFANNAAHSSVPLNDLVAAARNAGQERPQAGACALLLTGASTAASLPHAGSASMRSVLAWSIAIGLLGALTAVIAVPSAAQNSLPFASSCRIPKRQTLTLRMLRRPLAALASRNSGSAP